MKTSKIYQSTETGWHDDNIYVQDARLPFARRASHYLQINGIPLMGGFPSEERLKAKIDTRAYYTYPLLFYTPFSEISLAQLRALSLCGSYLFDHVLCLDKVLDRPGKINVSDIFLSHLLQQESLANLYALFPPNNAFWAYFNDYYAHCIQAVIQERAHHHYLCNPYQKEDWAYICAGKPAIGKVCIAALALLGQREELIPALTASHDAFYVAFQILDDLQDWCVDYQRHHYSYFLTEAFLQAGWDKKVESHSRPSPESVAELLQTSDIIPRLQETAVAYLTQAESVLGDEVPPNWLAVIRRTTERILAFQLPVESNASEPITQTPIDEATTLDWRSQPPHTTAVPITAGWLDWLDPARSIAPLPDTIQTAQQAILHQFETATSLGEAICQVGIAIADTISQYPETTINQQLGLSDGEWAWCQHQDRWLEGLLALSLDEPALLWSPITAVTSSGWLLPAMGRYLGYKIVQEYRQGHNHPNPTPAMILEDYRHQLIA